MPHDTKDDVLEKFLSKILPGSGTVYRSDWSEFRPSVDDSTVASSTPAGGGTGSTPPTVVVRQTAKRTQPAAITGAPVKSALLEEAPALRKTKRRVVCKMIPLEKMTAEENHHVLTMRRVCYHVTR